MVKLTTEELDRLVAQRQALFKILHDEMERAAVVAVSHWKENMTEEEVDIYMTDIRRRRKFGFAALKVLASMQRLEAL